MRARSMAGLMAALLISVLVPAAVSAQSSQTLVADNPGADCQAPIPATMVTGELGDTVIVADDAEIDKLTLASEPGSSVVDAGFGADGHEATVVTSDDVSAYIVWSCAPMNGEPIQRNDDQEV